MNLPCPECSRDMLVNPMKGGGFHFLCYGRDPVDHRVTVFWKRPVGAGLPDGMHDAKGGAEDHPERDRAPDSVPRPEISVRVNSLLARAEKLTQRRVGNGKG